MILKLIFPLTTLRQPLSSSSGGRPCSWASPTSPSWAGTISPSTGTGRLLSGWGSGWSSTSGGVRTAIGPSPSSGTVHRVS